LVRRDDVVVVAVESKRNTFASGHLPEIPKKGLVVRAANELDGHLRCHCIDEVVEPLVRQEASDVDRRALHGGLPRRRMKLPEVDPAIDDVRPCFLRVARDAAAIFADVEVSVVNSVR